MKALIKESLLEDRYVIQDGEIYYSENVKVVTFNPAVSLVIILIVTAIICAGGIMVYQIIM